MFYLANPRIFSPADTRPGGKKGSQFRHIYKKFRSNFSGAGRVYLPAMARGPGRPIPSEDWIKTEHGEVHFADLFPLKFKIAFLLPDTPGVIQRMKSALFISPRLAPGQTEQIESKRMKSLRHVRLLCSTSPILRRQSKIVNIFHKITIL